MDRFDKSCIALILALVGFLAYVYTQLDNGARLLFVAYVSVVLAFVVVITLGAWYWIGRQFPSAQQELERANKEFKQRQRLRVFKVWNIFN